MASATFELRAVDETKAAFASVQNSLDKLDNQVSKIGRGFNLGNILKDVVKGVGVGSGFQLVQTAMDYLVSQKAKEAELEETILRIKEDQLQIVRETIAARQNPQQQIDTLKKKFEEAKREYDKIQDVNRRTFTPQLEPGWAFLSKQELEAAKTKKVVAALTDEERLRSEELTKVMGTLGKQIDGLTISEDKLVKKERELLENSDQMRRRGSFAAGMKRDEEEFDKFLKVAQDSNEQSKKNREEQERLKKQVQATAESYRQLEDPMRIFKIQIAEVDQLERDGILTMQEADDIRDAIDIKRDEAYKHLHEQNANVKEDANLMAMAANEVAASFASAFESAVIGGAKLSDMMRSLGKDILAVFLRMTVTNNLINAMFGGITGFQKLPAFEAFSFKADGGPVKSNSPYIVGEEGPELFIPKSDGTIIPNHRMSAGAGSSGVNSGGSSVNVTYNISSGVNKAELMPILENERKRLKAEIPDMVRRGGAYRAAFA